MWVINLFLIIILFFIVNSLSEKVNKLSEDFRLLRMNLRQATPKRGSVYSKQTNHEINDETNRNIEKGIISSETIPNMLNPSATVSGNISSNDIPQETSAEISYSKPHAETSNNSQTKFYSDEGNLPNADFNIQTALLGNIFNKIGALAIIIAIIILVKLVSPYIVFTDTMKFFSGLLLGFGFVATGIFLHTKPTTKKYSEVLIGTGFASLFITSICGYTLLDIYNFVGALMLGGFWLILTYVLAEKMKTSSMVAIGLIGGYMTCVFTRMSSENLFAFLIFLNAISLIFTLRNKNYNIINLINLILTLISVLISYFVVNSYNILCPIILWGLYLIYDLLRDKTNMTDTIVSVINYVVLTFFSIHIFKDAHYLIAILLAVMSFVYLLMRIIVKLFNNNFYKAYDNYVLLSLGLCVFFACNNLYSIVVWSIMAFILSIWVIYPNRTHLYSAMLALYSTAFIRAMLLDVNGEYCLMASYPTFWNIRTLVFLLPAILILLSSRILKLKTIKISNFLHFTGITIGYLYILGEINSLIINNTNADDFVDFNKLMTYIILAIIYSINTKRLFTTTQYHLFNIASTGLFLLGLSVLLVNSFTYPSEYISFFNLRFVAYVLSIVACILFAKWDIAYSKLCKYLIVILGFILCHIEVVSITKLNDAGSFLISLVWIIYSAITTTLGIIKKRDYLTNPGICLVVLTIGRIFLYDLAKVEAIYKLLGFLILGIILMGISYIYTINKNK